MLELPDLLPGSAAGRARGRSVTQPQGGNQRGAVKTYWLTAGALGLIVAIVSAIVTLISRPADKPASAPPAAVATPTAPAPPPLAESNSTSPAVPSSRFTKDPTSQLRVPWPDCYSWVDLDVPKVVDDTDESDLTYEFCDYTGSISHYSSSELGVGPATEPASPEQCVGAAQSQALKRVAKEDLAVGSAFCVVTNRGNVVWLKLIRKIGQQDSPDLLFEMVRWLQAI